MCTMVYNNCNNSFFLLCLVAFAKAGKNNASYFSVQQRALGHCVKNAPVAFLKDFKVKCVTLLESCPAGSPLQTLPTDLGIQVKNGQGGMSSPAKQTVALL